MCKFIYQQISIHDHYVRLVTEVIHKCVFNRPAWKALQKQDKHCYTWRHQGWYGSSKKIQIKHLKLLDNMYRPGSLFLASYGLFQVKQADKVHYVEYHPIVILSIYVSSVIQSLHLKLNHPLVYQFNKITTRHFLQ